MKTSQQHALIGLNALLLGLLAVVTLSPGAEAQAKRARPKGQYGIVDGKFQGAQESAIYVFDSANQELIALRWDRSRKNLNAIGYRNIEEDAKNAEKGGR